MGGGEVLRLLLATRIDCVPPSPNPSPSLRRPFLALLVGITVTLLSHEDEAVRGKSMHLEMPVEERPKLSWAARTIT